MHAMSDRQLLQVENQRESAGTVGIRPVASTLSVSEAAEMLGVNERAIRRAIQRGDLIATKQGRLFQIALTALDEFRAAQEQPSDTQAQLRLVEPAAPDLDDSGPVPIPLFGTADQLGRIALPAPLTLFVGRTREIPALRALLLRDDVRLITLTGPGGVGKTRLALQVARDVATEFLDDAVFVPLAAVRDPELIASTVAKALGLLEGDGQSAGARLTSALRDRQLLLILDNFEHLAAAQALENESTGNLLMDILTSCPEIKILVTSRTLLRISGEHAFVVPPMALPRSVVPGAGEESPPNDLGQVESIQLFVDRARSAWSDFALTPENAGQVAAICEQVDGLPLAIELAAARSAVLSPAALLARLTRRLRLLTGGPHDQPARLRTMRDAIAWSYDLLEAVTQERFRRLAVFAGGFTLAAAETVADHSHSEHNSPHELTESVLDSLGILITSSLIERRDDPSGEPRFILLETVREFALEQLIAAGKEDATRAAHAGFYLAMMEQTESQLWASANKTVLDEIEIENDNMRAALSWAIEYEPESALRWPAHWDSFGPSGRIGLRGESGWSASSRPALWPERANGPSRSVVRPRSRAIKGTM
jgi:excisionase family DNA binding protein